MIRKTFHEHYRSYNSDDLVGTLGGQWNEEDDADKNLSTEKNHADAKGMFEENKELLEKTIFRKNDDKPKTDGEKTGPGK